MSHARRYLRVDLGTGQTEISEVPERYLRQYVGGRGLAARFLFDEVKPGTDPLGPGNKLLFAAGPLAGTSASSSSRWMAVTKSPLTGGYGRSSGGGDFGGYLRRNGYDLVIVEGRAERPCYVEIDGTHVRIHDAADLWGKSTTEAQQLLRDRHGKEVRIACIGPAAERLVRFAGIVSDRRIAGRNGVGTVMGSKNLKAIVLHRGETPKVQDRPEFTSAVKEQLAHYTGEVFEQFSEMGTCMAEFTNVTGIFPVKNFREGQLPNYEQTIAGPNYVPYKRGNSGCLSCAIQCGNVFEVTSGPYAGAVSEGPEYESIWAFSGMVGADNPEATILADQLCDDYGLDTISTGATIAFAFELYERGILTPEDTGGLELTWGNHEVMIELIRQIGERRGLGDLLAEGSLRAARRIGRGAESYAMHVKGQELPAYDPRGAKAHGLNLATAATGANHNMGYASQEVFGVPVPYAVDRFEESGKGALTKFNQDMTALFETGIACTFPVSFGWIDVPIFGRLMKAATGIEEFAEESFLWQVGERICNLERAFNVREGFGRQDDYLPQRLRTEPLQRGPAEGHRVENMDLMLDEYYAARGWDKFGVPTREKLAQLGMTDVAEALAAARA
ncbi:MAG: aldehyde ferredoxin oxidoreductase family protein [Bacillota bacterium]|nr:aldehyde ferredoxin oxidoreductase family protein [Bacillota bacterium]